MGDVSSWCESFAADSLGTYSASWLQGTSNERDFSFSRELMPTAVTYWAKQSRLFKYRLR